MKRILSCALAGLLLTGCKSELTVGRDIRMDDITEFYYTYENINYNASYLRYHFYMEEDRYMFFHEARERKDDYGPTDEKDVTAKGTLELSHEEWEEFYEYLKDGSVKSREDSLLDGDSGPWLYLYWKNDRSEYQEYSFVSWERRESFEAFCDALAMKEQ